MDYSAHAILKALLAMSPRATTEAPREARGLYGLVDHRGDLRYIGSTSSYNETLYKRIHQRHRTGSEHVSHYFSYMYNTGRMWRDRQAPQCNDATLAKALRNAFIADHCKAVWVSLPDALDIGALEQQVLSLAPSEAIAWNGRATAVYDEPVDLVDQTIARLGWGSGEIAAIERQSLLHSGFALRTTRTSDTPVTKIRPFPRGDFRFFALDVETANGNRASICQIGVACVRQDNTIETWSTYVDPKTDVWTFTTLHGIGATKVSGAPTFEEILPMLTTALAGRTIYQHSGFDRSAFVAACQQVGLRMPNWTWQNSVTIARQAWPELSGNGGHGLASLKRHLGLQFEHHDAGEDARASAQVVLFAEASRNTYGAKQEVPALINRPVTTEHLPAVRLAPRSNPIPQLNSENFSTMPHHIGTVSITQGNITNNHIYLRNVFDRFPPEAIGGSNQGAAADREITIDWGGTSPVQTDLDGTKKIFRKRGWIRDFFERKQVAPGTIISIDQTGPLRYRLSLVGR